MPCLRSHRWAVAKLGLEPGRPDPRAPAYNDSAALSPVGLSQGINTDPPPSCRTFVCCFRGMWDGAPRLHFMDGNTELSHCQTSGLPPINTSLLTGGEEPLPARALILQPSLTSPWRAESLSEPQHFNWQNGHDDKIHPAGLWQAFIEQTHGNFCTGQTLEELHYCYFRK